MIEKQTVESLRGSIEWWKKEADREIREATESKKLADKMGRELESIVRNLPCEPCFFCDGQMFDYATLKPFADRLGYHFHNQGERFCYQCETCEVYQTHEPLPTSDFWRRDEIGSKSRVFAATLFDHFPDVEVVALEKMAGRGWMMLVKGNWFAKQDTKDNLMRLWKIK